MHVNDCSMRTRPARSSDRDGIVAGCVAVACQSGFTRGLEAGRAEVA
jgi:hypothetical protein